MKALILDGSGSADATGLRLLAALKDLLLSSNWEVEHLALRDRWDGGIEPESLAPRRSCTPNYIYNISCEDINHRGYIENGGTALQVNMLDADMLRDAQQHPQDYRHLLVRITGYNAYFVTVGKELQNEVIARISHSQI